MVSSKDDPDFLNFLKSTSPKVVLLFHWMATRASLKKLLSERPVKRESESLPEYMRRVRDHLDECNRLRLLIRRIDGYFGRKRRKPAPSGINAIDFHRAAKSVRVLIDNSGSDELIADYLKGLFSSQKRLGGRPRGAMDSDRRVLDAFVLHESDPRRWTWPKVADELLKCKIHKKHTSEDSCTRKLSKAGERLRAFLKTFSLEETLQTELSEQEWAEYHAIFK